MIHKSKIEGADPWLSISSLDGLVGGEEEAVLGRVGDLRVDDGARDDVAVPVPPAAPVRRRGEHPGLVSLLGHHEGDSCWTGRVRMILEY